MKNTLLMIALVLCSSTPATATLYDRGNGLVYDDVMDITWFQDAGYIFTSGYLENGERMNWNEAMAWADALEYGGFDNWRLPTAFIEINISEVSNYWPAATEMGHLYLVDLNNVNIGSTLNTGPFQNLTPGEYWLSTQLTGAPPLQQEAHVFVFDLATSASAEMPLFNMDEHVGLAWAVHDGDIAAVPIPSAIWLLGSGLLVAIGIRKRLRKNI